MENKKISIVTVVYNSFINIEDTILSVINQNYKNIEYIIIDGDSTDGTKEIIRKHNENISYWISEPDNGIYDAMNKGIKVSNGDWILFLNAGDLFYNYNVLSKVNLEMNNCDVIYGKTAIKQKNGDLLIRNYYPLKMDWKVIPYCHQSVFIKSIFLKEILFETKYNIAADYNQYFKLKTKKLKFKPINEIISIYDMNGLSSLNNKKLLSEYKKIALSNHINLLTRFKIIIYYFLKTLLNKI